MPELPWVSFRVYTSDNRTRSSFQSSRNTCNLPCNLPGWCQYHNGTDANGQTLTQLVFQPGESYESCILSDVKYCHQEARACRLSTECTQWKGKCNDVFGKKTDSWCGNLCFAADKDDCCDINAGPVAGVAIGCILVVIFAIIGCCACCKCCCFKPKVVVVTQAPSA